MSELSWQTEIDQIEGLPEIFKTGERQAFYEEHLLVTDPPHERASQSRLDYDFHRMRRGELRYIARVDDAGLLGEGGVARVCRGYDAKMRRDVAVKRLKYKGGWPHRILELEAKLMARAKHPGVVPVYDYTSYYGHPTVIMPYMDPERYAQLDEWIGPQSSRSIEDKLTVLRSVAKIIDDLARVTADFAPKKRNNSKITEEKIFHKDLKPSCIYIDRETLQVQISDFGFGYVSQLGGKPFVFTTESYCSPDAPMAVRLEEWLIESEVFTLGLIAYELLLGKLPPLYEGRRITDYINPLDSDKIRVLDQLLHPRYVPLQKSIDAQAAEDTFGEDCIPEVNKVFKRVFQERYTRRYHSAGEFITAPYQALAKKGVSK
ncbi:serine/threonine protein kinase [Patescibacteria group bacterium]